MSETGDRYRPRATQWRLRTRTLQLPRRPLLMGIVNVTPDSFSDGGEFCDPERAIAHGLEMAAAGADLIDIGAESTRPSAEPVDVDEELRRILPVVASLAEQHQVPLSVDTYKAVVARECLAAGAEVINDVTALSDPEMLAVAVERGPGVCAMHMQGTPQTMQNHPRYENVVEEVMQFLLNRRDVLVAAGIPRDRIALDPGIGFGKTHEHNLALLAASYRFHELGCPLLVGPSRKGFIGKVLGDKQVDPTAGTIGVCLALALQGVQVLRVHDVQAVRQALQLFEACGAYRAPVFP